jgi:cytochrome b6-f complex iron-sulfur subunit
MNREEFLKQLGITAWLTCTGSVMLNCSQDDPAPGASNVDFVLDLTANQNAALNTVGGSLSSNGIIIARLSNTEFVALSRACTHEGTGVNYRSNQQDFLCPNHGARFSTTGAVLQGPARTALRKYNTELTGNNLRIFS